MILLESNDTFKEIKLPGHKDYGGACHDPEYIEATNQIARQRRDDQAL